jgi:YfiH family protein
MNAAPGERWLEADWPAPPGVRALTTMRRGMGVSRAPVDGFNLGLRNGDDPDATLENRRQLEVALALPSAPRWLRQVHGTTVAHVDSTFPNAPPLAEEGGERAARAGGDEPEADAAITTTPGSVLAILPADGLPVAVAATDGADRAVAHAGWRGLVAGVLEATVAAMRTPPSRLVAWLGPAAGPGAYEIGAEVFDAFALCDPRAETAFVPTRPGHWNVDLYALAKRRLADVGVVDVHGGGLCTMSDPSRFFSHRRDQRTGRMATLAWIEPR